jgi:hypothetical protein
MNNSSEFIDETKKIATYQNIRSYPSELSLINDKIESIPVEIVVSGRREAISVDYRLVLLCRR